MFDIPLQGAKLAIEAIGSSLNFNKALRDGLLTSTVSLPAGFEKHPDFEEWRKLDHSVTVSSLYQVYESLIHECIAEWLETLSNLVPYTSLPEKVKHTHQDGIGFILQNSTGRRFSNLSITNLIREYKEALSDSKSYKLHADAFLLHDRNLKIEELQALISSCGLEINIADWLKNNRLINQHDSIELLGHSSADKVISALVDLRNEAAHATRQLGTILGEELLIAYVKFMLCLADALVEGITHAALQWHKNYGDWAEAGKINFIKKDSPGICVAPIASCTISKGMEIYLLSKYICTRAIVNEMRVNNIPLETKTIGLQAEEVGLMLSTNALKGCIIHVKTTPIVLQTQLNLPNPEIVIEDQDEEETINDKELTDDEQQELID